VLPADFVADAQERCRATIERGDGKPLPERVSAAVAVFGELGVSLAQLETKVGRKRGYWTPSDLADLLVLHSSLKRGEASVDELFPPITVTASEITGQPAAPVVQPEETDEEPPVDDDEPMATQRQLTKLHASLNELGVKERGDKLQTTSMLIGRQLTTSNQITAEEIQRLFEILDGCLGNEEPERALDAVLANSEIVVNQ